MAKSTNGNSLLKQVEDGRLNIRAEGYAMSLGELASLYEEGEINISPRFQRFFRWTLDQKSRLIESLLLGIPLPQVFVSQTEEGVWEVVDGLQRLSAVLQFMGRLRDSAGELLPPLELTSTTYLPGLDGVRWESLPRPLQLDFRRAKVNLSILNRGGDQRAKYDLFERLNTGGTPLSEQEVRNCILIMENEGFYDWLLALSENEDFRNCVAISDKLASEGYHMELACRLLCFSQIAPSKIKGDVGSLITEWMVALAKSPKDEREGHERAFADTFRVLAADELGESVFKRFFPGLNDVRGAFLSSPYEVVACGMAHHLAKGESVRKFRPAELSAKVREMWGPKGFLAKARQGWSATRRLQSTIPFGRKSIKP